MPFGELDYSELSSQLPTSDQGDLGPSDAKTFDLGDYDLREEESVSLSEHDLSDQENIDPRAHRFDESDQEGDYDSPYDEAVDSSTSIKTEIIPGGTRLKARIPLHKEGIGCNGRLPAEAPQYEGFDVMDEAPSQPATQLVPPKEGHNGLLTEKDESDVICILLPTSPAAHEAVELTARAAPQHILQNQDMSYIDQAPEEEGTTNTSRGENSEGRDDSTDTELPGPNQKKWAGSAKDIALRLSSKVHNLSLGFTFGRSPARCDLLLSDNADTRLSNVHFRIFMNNNMVLMIEDTSTNGTIMDDKILRGPRAGPAGHSFDSKHTLCNNSTIEIPLRGKQTGQSIRFSVKMPGREAGQEKFTQNCAAYIKCVQQAERQHGFLAEAIKNGKAPAIPPIPMHAVPQGAFLGAPSRPIISTAATGNHLHGIHWGGGPKYNIVGYVGQGAFANVYKLSSKKDGMVFAAKQLDKRHLAKSGIMSSKIYNELNVIKSLRHPNIVKYVDHHETPEWLFIIMEYIHLGDLACWTRAGSPMPEFMGTHVARQILQAVDYLHKRGITHRDLKPDNILMEKESPYVFKLSDFGLSKMVINKETFLKTFCGTMMYCAPEVYPGYVRVKTSMPNKRLRPDKKYDHTFPYHHSVDIWGLGAVLYHLLSGEPPFTAKHDPQGEDMLWALLHTSVNWERLKMVGVSQLGVDFISRMLVTEPSERAPDQELLDHPWLLVAEGPADADDCVLSDPTERLNAHASQLSIGDEEPIDPNELIDDGTEDPRDSKRARAWVPDLTRNVWGETASMVVRNQQRGVWPDGPQHDMELSQPSFSGPQVGVQHPPNRLFGEIGSSALASSGALGFQGNRALQIQGVEMGSDDISSDALYDDSRPGSPDGASAANEANFQDANRGTTQNPTQKPPAPTQSGAAPSLLGTESLFGQIKMASMGSNGSVQAENGKAVTLKLSKDPESPSSRPSSKRSNDDMMPSENEGASKRLKSTSVEYPPARHASNLGRESMSPVFKPGSRASVNRGSQEGQQSRATFSSNHDLPSTAFNSRESTHFEAEGDIVMGDGGDSDDEVSRLEEALAAAKAKKLAKSMSRTNSRPISRVSSRPSSSHGDVTATTDQPMTGIEVFDAAAHHATPATASFAKPALRFGKIQPTRGSIQTPTIFIMDRLTTYGRKPDSTFVHPDPREDRIPKQALDIQMWYPGIEADIEAGKTDWVNHPKLEAILRTRTSHYVQVNGVKLKKGQGEYLWGRLRTGDVITIVEPALGATSARSKEYLRFRCEFFIGLSKNVRKPGEKKFVVEVEKDKFKVAEERKSRESTAALGASKGSGASSVEKGKGRDSANNTAGKS